MSNGATRLRELARAAKSIAAFAPSLEVQMLADLVAGAVGAFRYEDLEEAANRNRWELAEIKAGRVEAIEQVREILKEARAIEDYLYRRWSDHNDAREEAESRFLSPAKRRRRR